MSPPYSWTRCPDDATQIARQARRAGLVTALRARPDLSLDQLIRLVADSKYADDLCELRIEELLDQIVPPPNGSRVAIENAVMRVFRAFPEEWFSSGFFVRYLGLERWTAQKICVEAAEDGRLDRQGRTSATRYRLAYGGPQPTRAAVS